ncbi:hypothetical protein DFH01_23880 [Falsiroseomonas bella]|uniref:Uncharacterized protein n=2 Tax=Falsiroseomonas bella TaxID=2184016 RepID=A0A317F7Y6_9PROT|nr:hypothetical protein DFH01_23880 [Falsiroseomonas bella]
MSFIRPLGNAIPADRLHASDVSIPSDANALCERVMEASPGQVIIYHRGELARDRDRYASELPEQQRIELDVVANYAWRLADAGWCHLLQRREAPNCFLYLLVLRPRPHQQRVVPKPPRRPVLPSLSLLAEAA